MAAAILAAILAAVFPAALDAAGPDQRIVSLESGAYRTLAGLYLEQGLAPPSSSLPYTHEELRRSLRRLDHGSLSEAGRLSYRTLEDLLTARPAYEEEGGLRFYPSYRANPEVYLHTNRDNTLWVYDAAERRPFLGFYFDIVLSNRMALYGDLTVQKDVFQTGGDPDNYTGVLTSPYQADLNVPYRAGASFGGRHWNLWLGRDLLSWGSGRTGNLMLSDADIYHEGLRFTSFYDRFKFTFLVLGLESWTDPSVFGTESWNRDGGFDEPYIYPAGQDPAALERFKVFIAHRFEFLFRPNLRFAMNESVVYGGKYPDYRIFNPMLLYHNLYLKEWLNNMMTLELDYAPVPGLLLYGQFAMDQFSTAFEQKTYGLDSEPNAMGYLAGVEYRRPVGTGHFSAAFEFVKTDPWLYIREHPLVSFLSTRRIHSEARKDVLGDRNYYFLNTPIGYPRGPDVIVNSLLLSYTEAGRRGLYAEYRLVFAGEHDVTTPFVTGDAAWEYKTPSGNADTENIARLGGWYRISRSFSVFAEAAFVYNDGETDLQLAAGVRWKSE